MVNTKSVFFFNILEQTALVINTLPIYPVQITRGDDLIYYLEKDTTRWTCFFQIVPAGGGVPLRKVILSRDIRFFFSFSCNNSHSYTREVLSRKVIPMLRENKIGIKTTA